MAVGDIVITVGADIAQLARELTKAKGHLSDFERSGDRMGSVLRSAFPKVAQAAAVVTTAVVALTVASMANIDAMSKQARAAGISVAAFQSMAMVASEAGVESDKLSKILIKMQDNIASLDAGAKAQTEQFAALGLSMRDLSGLGADEQFALIAERIAAIADPATRTAAALNIFGKSGADAITMFEGYGAAAKEAAEFQQRFGIAVSDLDAQNIEAANDAMGRLWEVAKGLGNQLAAAFAPALENTANFLIDMADATFGARTNIEEFFGSLEEARAILGDDVFNRMMGNPEEIVKHTDALDDISAAADTLHIVARGMADELDSVAYSLSAIGQSAAAVMMRSLADETEIVRQRFDDGTISAEQFADKMADIQARAVAFLTTVGDMNGLDMSPIIGRFRSLGEAILKVLGLAQGLKATLPGGGAGMDSGTPLSLGDDLLPPNPMRMDSSPRPVRAPNDPDFGLPDPPDTSGGGGGGGGGGGSSLQSRIEALTESLQTEREIIQAWYEESLMLLNTASEAELAALGGKHEAIERLEEEHQKRLGAIKEEGNRFSLEAALGGAAEVLGAMGAFNKKALKLQAVASAGQALISTYEGAAKELRKGTLGFATAAAVVARGLGFVAAIRSAVSGGGGGGGGGAGGSGAAAAAAAARPTQNVVIDMINASPSQIGGIQNLVNMLTEANRQGYDLNAIVRGA